MTNELRRKIWNLIRGGNFHGYIRRSEGYPLTLTDCMAEYPVSLAISGNTVQDGTPAPDNPVEVQGVGDKTSNLFNIDNVTVNGFLLENGDTYPNTAWNTSYYIPVSAGTYTIGEKYKAYCQWRVCFYDSAKTLLLHTSAANYIGYAVFEAPEGTAYMRFSYSITVSSNDIEREEIRLNEGGAILAYEPYGYKVPLALRNSNGEQQTFTLYTDTPLHGDGNISDTVELDVRNRHAIRNKRVSVDDSGNVTQLANTVTTDISDKIDWESIPKLWRGTAILTADTTVSPSALVCDYYSKNRVWGVRFPTAALSSSPTGTRTCLAKGMVAIPSTDKVKNRNDFDNVPAFRYDYVNGYLDENYIFVETAVKGKDDTFAFDGSNGDVYSRFKLSYWRRLTGDGYVEYQITHEYIPNDGWCPFGIFVNPDGTLNDYAYIASYEMGYNSEGLCASVSGVPVAHNTYANRNATTSGLSHNTQLTEFRKKGNQYCGMTSKEVMFLQYLFMIEFATLNSQSIMYGAASYNYQYKVAVAE